MPGPPLPPQLYSWLAAGESFVLPNAAAVAGLHARFDQQRAELGRAGWEPPALSTWSGWTSALWNKAVLEGSEERLLLNRLQEEALWVEVIGGLPAGLSTEAGTMRELAKIAASGFGLAGAHLAVDRLRRSADSFDSRTFATWVDRFLALCRDRRMLSTAMLEAALAGHLRSGAVRAGGAVHLLGHEQFTPAQSALLGAVQAAGTSVMSHGISHRRHDPGEANTSSVAVVTADLAEEIGFGLRLARKLLTRTDASGAGTKTVAMLLPDADVERPELDRQLRDLLAPELEPVGTDLSSTPWQFSRELPLAKVPVVGDALQLLQWIGDALPLERVGQLLLSPFFDHADSFEARARFEMGELRRRALLKAELTLPDVLRLRTEPLRRRNVREAVHLTELQALQTLVSQTKLHGVRLGFADWTERLRGCLRAVGWPGSRDLSPAEFRATEAWEAVLDSLATLDVHGDRVDLSTLLGTLQHEVQSYPTPRAKGYAPLQIMTLAETEGSAFDAVLVLRATDENLPAPERLHPLLGKELQRSLSLPGSGSEQTYARVRERLRSLTERSGTVILTAAAHDAHGPLRLTPLATELGFERKRAEELVPPDAVRDPVEQLTVRDLRPVPPLPSAAVAGGAAVLELQAACGFRAFASLRLGADAPEGRSLGLDARETGSILHGALDHFWSEVKSQAELRAMPDAGRRDVVRRAVMKALQRYRAVATDTWGEAYMSVLQQRFEQVLGHWLGCELARSPFTVLAREAKQTIAVGPLELEIRPDRVDSVEDGCVFVDYKSASALSASHWLGERPQAPQLPLYVLLGDPEEVRGLAFARVRPGKDMGWLSMADRRGLFPAKGHRTEEELSTQIIHWKAELAQLAQDFADGRAEVDPKRYPQTCKHCGQRLLCRLNADTLLAQADDADTDDPESHG